MKFCPNCGNELSAGVKFCPSCGFKVSELEVNHSQNEAVVNEPVQSNVETQVEPNQAAPSSKEAVTNNQADVRPVPPVQNNNQENSSQSSYAAGNNQTEPSEQPQLGFVGSVQYVFQHVFEFKPTPVESRKSVFWWAYLGVFILNCFLVLVPMAGPFLTYISIVLLVSACMRRLAYLNYNWQIGWLILVPIVGLYPMVLMFFNQKKAG